VTPDPVSCNGIRKNLGSRQVLADVSFTIAAGSVFGLVGLNGAGKTTLIRILLGLLKADFGACLVLGHDPWRHEPVYYKNIGVVLEHNGFFGNLTAQENIHFFARAKGMSPEQRDGYLQEQWAGVGPMNSTGKVRTFSRGEKMQCGICRAFMGWPQVLLLDEPAVALDMQAYDHLCSLVHKARENGSAVLISSHQLDAIEELCDVVGILESGKISILRSPIQGVEEWLVSCPDSPEYAEIIRVTTGALPLYKGGAWHFVVAGSAAAIIPALVSRLVAQGCVVQEVRRVSGNIKDSIRQHYSEQA
jgi:ABC-2 type transport system ATP-binding protein